MLPGSCCSRNPIFPFYPLNQFPIQQGPQGLYGCKFAQHGAFRKAGHSHAAIDKIEHDTLVLQQRRFKIKPIRILGMGGPLKYRVKR